MRSAIALAAAALAAAVLAAVPVARAQQIDAGKIDGVMKEWARKDAPGCAVAVLQRGKVVLAKGYGMADLERDVPITPETVFDIGSTSKQFTASAILLLAADGKLKLDDNIRKHLPELPQLGKAPITIRHLLHHTGGLRDYMTLFMMTGTTTDDVTTSAETLAMLARQKGVEFEPGAKHAYSNTGYFVLAQIAERASKLSMTQLVGDRIFKPLGMARTIVYDDHTRIVRGRAIGYAPKPGGGWRLDMSGWEQTGDGAVLTTVLDLAKWDANFYDPKVGGRALVDALQERGKTSDAKVLDYAAGLMHGTYRGRPTVSHGGAWAGYRAQLERFPTLGTSVVVLCNAASSRPGKLAREIADVVLDKQLGPPDAPKPAAVQAPVKLTAAELDAWVGRYRDVASGGIAAVTRAGDALSVDAGGEAFALLPAGKRTFKFAIADITVEFSGAAPKRKIAARGQGFEENYEEVATYAPTAADLAAYAGRYHSPELGTLWTLAVQNGALVATGPGAGSGVLAPSIKDELSLPGGITLKLTRTSRGVTGFAAGAGSTQGIRFDKLP